MARTKKVTKEEVENKQTTKSTGVENPTQTPAKEKSTSEIKEIEIIDAELLTGEGDDAILKDLNTGETGELGEETSDVLVEDNVEGDIIEKSKELVKSLEGLYIGGPAKKALNELITLIEKL